MFLYNIHELKNQLRYLVENKPEISDKDYNLLIDNLYSSAQTLVYAYINYLRFRDKHSEKDMSDIEESLLEELRVIRWGK